MLGFRLNPPGPFWFEDLMFFVIDEGRRLPKRAAVALSRIRRLADTAARKAADFDPKALLRVTPTAAPATAIQRHREVAPLDESETWLLATEPLAAVGTATHAAVALHNAASEQLDALTYVLARMRDDLRPIMTCVPFKDDNVLALHADAELETSIEALLELSRRNAATRPKDRMRTAA
ncbi:hypothetical protein [Hyphomicrobium sp.]|uniref:hypothetical protein n=1 Tax=Hyphomicrobium sp. TaxID=82 RepID=UPI0025C6BB56|nr:hypothetical protein [Hyphomicrobium sp.]MCC7250421.1 hypothetical protein [Hyphomicrobium sp.]